MQTILILSTIIFWLASTSALEASGGVVQLTGISFGSPGTGTVQGYINALYLLAIGIGAAIAVLRLILAGAKYMLTDVVTQKGEAKKDVQGAVVGLLIILTAILILETINPNLNNFDVLNLTGVNRPADEPDRPGANIVTPAATSCRDTPGCEFIQCAVQSGPDQCAIERGNCSGNADITRVNGLAVVACYN